MFLGGIILLVLIQPSASTIAVLSATDACSPLRPGGAVCTCNMTVTPVYNCSSRGLTEVPFTFEQTTTQVDLSHNRIQVIYNSAFINSTYAGRSMRYVFLNHNDISIIQNKGFMNLIRVRQLYLNNNRLSVINNHMFEHLASLEILDLSNNPIVTINRHALFSVPNIYQVSFDNVAFDCTCEERLFLEFLQVRTNPPIVVRGANCTNINNSPLSSLQLSDFPSCPAGEVLFEQSTCYTCADSASLSVCAQSTPVTCSFPRAVCYSQVDYDSGGLGVWGGCIDYSTCILNEKVNPLECINQSLTSCYFCSHGNLPNAQREMRVIKAFRTKVTITLATDMTPDLRDNTTAFYGSFTWNLATEVDNFLRGAKGAFIVEFTGLSEPRVTLNFNINCSTIWYNSRESVFDTMKTTLLNQRFNGFIVEDVYVTVITEGNCDAEDYTDPLYGQFSWPGTIVGAVAYANCPHSLSTSLSQASRRCVSNADGTIVNWETPVITECAYADITSRQIQDLAATPITDTNAADVSSNISALTESWQNLQTDTVSMVTDVVEGIINTDVSKTTQTVATNTLSTINNVMFVETAILTRSQAKTMSSTRILNALDNLLQGVDVVKAPYQEVKENVAGQVASVTPANYKGATLSVQNRRQSALTDGNVVYTEGERDVASGQSGIVLPASLFTQLRSTNPSKVSMVLLRGSELFQSIVGKNETREVQLNDGSNVTVSRAVNSYVIGATVSNHNVQDLTDPVKVRFQHFRRGVNASCVYWDDQSNKWSGEGCTLQSTSQTSSICHCRHLTNFALLMDVYGTGGGLSEADRLALAIISYIGCGISLVAVILTLITYLGFKKLRRDNPSKILMNLCLAIGLADFVFLAGMQDYTSNSDAGCKLVAVLLHYFLLAAMCWMAVEAFYMYLALVKVFDSHVERFQLKSSLFGWAIPLVVVICTIAINKTDNYGIQPGGICWLDSTAFYAAFLIPVCLILLGNFVVFVLVLRQIMRRSSSKLSKTERSNTAVRLRGAISLIILLGLTWLFAIFAVDNYGLVFHYLFAIFNSLQGFFIFIFYCFLKKEAQQSWKACLPCCRSPYEPDKTSKGFSSTLNTTRTNKTHQPEISSATASTTVSDQSTIRDDKGTAFRGRWQFPVTEKPKTTSKAS